jgi:hypothetical protein
VLEKRSLKLAVALVAACALFVLPMDLQAASPSPSEGITPKAALDSKKKKAMIKKSHPHFRRYFPRIRYATDKRCRHSDGTWIKGCT